MIRVGIMGATGYMGGEALRVLLDHPEVEIAWLTSRTEEFVDEHHPKELGADAIGRIRGVGRDGHGVVLSGRGARLSNSGTRSP